MSPTTLEQPVPLVLPSNSQCILCTSTLHPPQRSLSTSLVRCSSQECVSVCVWCPSQHLTVALPPHQPYRCTQPLTTLGRPQLNHAPIARIRAGRLLAWFIPRCAHQSSQRWVGWSMVVPPLTHRTARLLGTSLTSLTRRQKATCSLLAAHNSRILRLQLDNSPKDG